MTNHKREHKLYSSIAEHLKFLGTATFDLMLGFCGFGGFMIYAGNELFTWLLGGWGGIIVNRRFTKGKDLKPFLVFGIIPGPSGCWPCECRVFVA